MGSRTSLSHSRGQRAQVWFSFTLKVPPLPAEGSWLPPGPLLCGSADAAHVGAGATLVRLSHSHLPGPHGQSSERKQSLCPGGAPQLPGDQVRPIFRKLE